MARKKKLTPFQEFERNVRETDAADDEITVQRAGEESTSNTNRPSRVRRAGLTEAALPDTGPTDDDLAPETLIHEDGALSPSESGDDVPADRAYRIASAAEIGAGFGLDEAELARVDPLDGEPWDEDEQPEHQ